MGHWDDIRARARERHRAALDEARGDSSARALLAASARITGVIGVPVHAGDPLLDGGHALLDPSVGLILFNQDVEPWRVLFYQAHEYAHLWLGGERAFCDETDMDAGDASDVVRAEVEGYGPHERREREANTFAMEFLLPCDVLRRWFLADNLTATAIAGRTGLPWGLVCQQLTRAVLGPLDDAVPVDAASPTVLDPGQEAAAHVPRGPFLLEAGPGTGKTRTLVQRILYLLDQGIAPSNMLALTFSNKAAEELRDRVARAAPEAAEHLWAGTFHAFGLELLRKYGTRVGLPARPAVLDPIEALFFLERALPDLTLDHYQNLYEPGMHLRDILAAISRAKDELVDPPTYANLAEAMRQEASTEREQEDAARACEVARVYRLYQERLDQDGLLDFGDLIARAVVLLREHAEVRLLVQRAYTHVLVDEYQDVNRASGLLLREVAGDGCGLWAVGDARQAIYRFRGAAPFNMRMFPRDFPGATIGALQRNYRSGASIVRLVSELAPRMRVSVHSCAPSWDTHRTGVEGNVAMEIAEDDQAEIDGLARTIREQHARGVAYGDQAVLCRAHTHLGRLAERLQAAGIPVLYSGNLCERDEVRDMLALLSLVCEPHGEGLVRVAQMAEYGVPLADIQVLLTLARQRGMPFPGALRLARDVSEISPVGQLGLALLSQHVESLRYGSHAWTLLMDYLFEHSQYLRLLAGRAAAGSVTAWQQCTALYHFLQWVQQHDDVPTEDGTDPKLAFIRYVRRLELLGQDVGPRSMTAGSGQDAVQMLTIHASKGLEFPVVYLPMLGQRYFPAPRQWQPCPPPRGMMVAGQEPGDHDDEEEALFFVAISRARDVLYLTRAERYGKQRSKASTLLAGVAHLLPRLPDGPPTWRAQAATQSETRGSASLSPLEQPSFEAVLLDMYLRCPRRYYYEQVLGLVGSGQDAPYDRFRRCVQAVLDWLQGEQTRDQPVNVAEAEQQLAALWEAHGPWASATEPLYRRTAEEIMARTLHEATSHDAPTSRTAMAGGVAARQRHGTA